MARLTPRGLAEVAVTLGAIAVAAACVLPLLPGWLCELLQHFRVQYAVTGVGVTVLAGALRARAFDGAAIATLVHLWWIAPDLSGAPRAIGEGEPVRVVMLNVHTEGRSYAQVRALIDELHPDVLGLVEVDQRWLAALAPSLAGYGGQLVRPRDDNFGVALYARAPIAGAIEYFGNELPVVVGRVSVGAAALDVVLIHPLPPMTTAALDDQARQLAAVGTRTRALTGPVLVMGDLNATPWSTPFRGLIATSGLCDSRRGFGIGASYPASSWVLRIPIDHALTSCDVGIRDRRVERDVGSDHLPIALELVVPR